MKNISENEKNRRVDHFRRVIFYRSILGWIFSLVGIVLFIVGLNNLNNPLVSINGFLFFAYGLFMVWQTKRAKEKLNSNS
jgi:uncharacterized membrane protein YiaA